MKFLPVSATRFIGRTILKSQAKSPALLFGAGVIGVVATAVLASRATLKLDGVIDQHETRVGQADKALSLGRNDYTDDDYKRDRIIIVTKTVGNVAKIYGPSLAVGVLSIAALTGSHVILTRRNFALTAAYAAIEKGFNEYRERVVGELGEDKDREFRYGTESVEIIEEGAKGHKVQTVTRVNGNKVPSMYAKFFDEHAKGWVRDASYNFIFLQCQQNYANDILHARGHLFLNEVYDALGLPRTSPGAVVGWCLNATGDDFVDFGIFDGSGVRRDFVNGREGSVLLDFNVNGIVYDLIESNKE